MASCNVSTRDNQEDSDPHNAENAIDIDEVPSNPNAMYDPERKLLNREPPKRFYKYFWKSITWRILADEKLRKNAAAISTRSLTCGAVGTSISVHAAIVGCEKS